MRTTIAVLAIAVAASLFLFQNCGQGLKASNIQAGNNLGSTTVPPVTTGPGPVIPGNTAFTKGDAFNYNSVPVKSQMMQTMIDSLGYTTYMGIKALAINAQGFGYLSRLAANANQADANKLALEGCFALGGGSPCALLAVGNSFEVSSAALPVSYTFSIPAPTGINAASLPFVLPAGRAPVAAAYNAATSPKALAVSADGAYSYVSAADAPAVTTLAEARRVALESCELQAAFPPCTIWAENGTVVMNPSAINRTPTIDFAKTTVMTSLPGMKDAHYAQYIQGYVNNVNGTNVFGVIYLSADGAGGFSYGPVAATAETNAKAFCESGVGTGSACFRYAINKTIQQYAPSLVSMKSFPVVNCKAIPRLNCAAHKALGCAAGLAYTMNGATPAVENCL